MNKEDAVKIIAFPVKLYGTYQDEENLDALKALLTNWNNVYPDHMIIEIDYSDSQVHMYLDFMTSVEGYYEIQGMVYTAFEKGVLVIRDVLVQAVMLRNEAGKRAKYEVFKNGDTKYAFVTVYESTPDFHVKNYLDLTLDNAVNIDAQINSHFNLL
ncbi:hypothetical protein [Klebsiella aerogenes]|uniref:hypothetical protein n=1 Tax=Klebsiella aerogenes TaxID=548 RepID=UPI000AF84739|nr:hypothetical protein [Klebsiella aerogenes]